MSVLEATFLIRMTGYNRGRLGAALCAVFALAAVAVSSAGAARDRAAAPKKRPAAPPIVLVQFRDPASAAGKVRAEGDHVAGTVGGRVHVIRIRSGQSAAARAAAYAKRKDVVYAEPAHVLKATLAAPNDPFGSAWWLNVIHALDGWSTYPNAYSNSGGVKIAIADTGVDPTHPDLDAKVDAADGANCIHWDFSGTCLPWGSTYSGDPPGYGLTPLDDHGHGTHVSGIAGGEANNATGVAGVAFNSPLIPIKVLDGDGFGTDFEIANGILWAKNHGASVINLSLGMQGLSTTLCNAVSQAVSAGVVVVAAAGNDNSGTVHAPAGCPGAIGVSATTSSDTRASFSNFGSPNVFVSAPGEFVTSSVPGGGYEAHSGTSMASPFTTGLVALLRSQQALTVAEVKHVLARTSDKIGGGAYGADPFHTCSVCTWNTFLGYGRINVERALHGMLPAITTFTPTSAAAGGLVTINGDALGNATSVTFTGAAPVTPTLLSPTQLRVTVPTDAGVGPITVTSPTGSATSSASFKPLARVTVPSTPVQAGDTVALSGSNLADVTAVKIGALSLSPGAGGFTVVSPTELDLFIPDAATTGAVSLTTPAGTSTSTTPLKIRPTIAEPFGPDHGFTGTILMLSGKTFTGTTSVKVGGVPAAFALVTGQLRVTVPAAAVTGPISVTNAGGTTATSGSFTVDPKITSFTPISGSVGTLVTLAGSGFGALGETRTLTVNGTSALALLGVGGVRAESVTWVSPNSLKFTVPAGATTGAIQLGVGTAAPYTTATPLKVLPKVTGYATAAARVGDTVTVQGTTLIGATAVKFGTVSGIVDSVSLDGTQLSTHVPPGALTSAVTVTTPGGTSTGPVFKVLPTVDEPFAPDHGFTGTVMTLTGKTFTGTTSVKVGGVPAAFALVTGQLKVTVPAAAVTGPISVTNAGGTTTTSGSFTVDPKITSFTPLSIPVGAVVTLAGSGFGASGESRTITVNGVAASTSSWVSPKSLKFTVPAGATTGPISLSVGTAAPFTTAATVKVLPKVTGYSAAAARDGDAVTVQGTTLNGATTVKFGAITGVVDSVSVDGTQLFTHVPPGALTGAVTVVTPGGTSIGPVFKVLPTVNEPFAPDHGFTGTVLMLSGKTFTGTSSVKVGGVPAAFALVTGQLKVTVPAAAVTGPISVTNAGGTTTTSGSFTVDPKITSFTPLTAPVGGAVTLAGSGFGAAGESRTVSVNGIAASASAGPGGIRADSVTWVSPNSVKFTVPDGATTGPISLSVGSAAPFTTAATVKVLPKVTGYVSAAAREGDAVTVQGTTLNGATAVKFGAVSGVVDSVSVDGTQLFTHVPPGALTGAVTVVTPGGTSIGPVFKVLPTVNEPFAPDHGFTGTVLMLSGKTFTGTTSVKVGEVPAAFALVTGQLKVTVPAAAVTGPISVTNAGGTTTTSGSFTVDPKVTTFAPTSGSTGATIRVNGSGFGGADRVDFTGGVSGVPTNVTANSLKVAVPAGATTGPISVHTPAGSSPASVASFTITLSVANISPTIGDYDTDVTITGVGLTGVTQVTFNGIAVPAESVTATSLHAHVPANSSVTGAVVVVKGLATAQAPQTFKLLHISSLSPAAGVPGTQITLTGFGFTGATGVAFNGTAATFVVDSATQITTRIPAGAATGSTVSVTVAGATAASSTAVAISDVSGVKINEFATGTTTAADDDFVELYNANAGAVDLSACELRYQDGDDVNVQLFSSSTPLLLAAGARHVVAPTQDLDAVSGGLKLTCGASDNDKAGWGAAPAGWFEGTAATAPAVNGSAARMGDGVDTGNNSPDFHLQDSPTKGTANPSPPP